MPEGTAWTAVPGVRIAAGDPAEMCDPRGTGGRAWMFGRVGAMKVLMADRPVGFRNGVDGLTLAVQEVFGLDPLRVVPCSCSRRNVPIRSGYQSGIGPE